MYSLKQKEHWVCFEIKYSIKVNSTSWIAKVILIYRFMFHFLGILCFAQTVKLLFSSLKMVVSAAEKPLSGAAEDISGQK